MSEATPGHPMYGPWINRTRPKPRCESRPGGGMKGQSPNAKRIRRRTWVDITNQTKEKGSKEANTEVDFMPVEDLMDQDAYYAISAVRKTTQTWKVALLASLSRRGT